MENTSSDRKKWYIFTLLFLVIEYGRIQDVIDIGFLRPGMILNLILIFFIAKEFKINIELSKSKQTTLMLLIVGLLFVYVPFANNNYWALQAAKIMALYIPFFISTIICVDSIDRMKKLIGLYILLMNYIALYAIFHAGIGAGAYFSDENDISLYLNMWVPICYFLFLYEKRKLYKMYYAFSFCIAIIAIVKSFSRGGFVGLVAVLFVIWLVSERKIVSLLAVLLVGLIMYNFVGDMYIQEMSTLTQTEEGTADDRIKTWESAWNMFLSHPWGVGGYNFPFMFADYQDDRFTKGMGGRAAHSLWFTLLPELGIAGIILYLRLIYFNLRDLFRVKNLNSDASDDIKYMKSLAIAIIASLVGFFASATFLSVLYYPHYWYMTALIVALANIANKQPQKQVVQ